MQATTVVLVLLQVVLLRCVRAEGWWCEEGASVSASCLSSCEQVQGCVGVGRGEGCRLLMSSDTLESAACIQKRGAALLGSDDAPADDDTAAAAVLQALEDPTLPAEARKLLEEVDTSDPAAMVQALSKATQVEGLSPVQQRLLSAALEASEEEIRANTSDDTGSGGAPPEGSSSSFTIVLVALVAGVAVLAGIAVMAVRASRSSGELTYADFAALTSLKDPVLIPEDEENPIHV